MAWGSPVDLTPRAAGVANQEVAGCVKSEECLASSSAVVDVALSNQPCVGISVHTKSVKWDAVKADLAEMKDLLKTRLASRQCAASSEIVWLQDGVYIPWKKPSTGYNVKHLVIFKWLSALGLKRLQYQIHANAWTTAGPGSTYADAERAVNPPKPIDLMTPTDIPGCEPSKTPTPSSFLDGVAEFLPRPLLTLDLVGSADDSAKDLALRKRANEMRYDQVLLELGSGSFGDVYSCESSVGLRAVKKLKIYKNPTDSTPDTLRTHCEVALAEVAVLERCANCPHIVTLLDVCKCGPRIGLIFEVWGIDLWELRRGNSDFCSGNNAGLHMRQVFEQSLKAVRFVHNLGVIHTDIKTPNLLVKWDPDALGRAPLHLRLADFGSCLVADPLRRFHIDPLTRRFRHEMRQITTPAFRSPEIVFGDKNFGTAIDLWALGIMMFSLSDVNFTLTNQPFSALTVLAAEQRLVAAWCSQLGTPSEDERQILHAFPWTWDFNSPALDSTMAACPVPRHVRAILGRHGCALLLRFLSWCAEGRGTAEAALEARFFQPERLTHVLPSPGESYADPRTCAFTGVRHLWNVVEGQVSPEIMAHMFGDIANIAKILVNTFNVIDAAVSPTCSKNCSVQQLTNATKYTIAGWLIKGAHNAKLNDMVVSKRMPFVEVRKWRNALVLIANVEAIATFWAALKDRLNSLQGDLGKSGRFLMHNHPDTWLWAVAEAHVTLRHCAAPRTVKRRKGAPLNFAIQENLHNDGAASGLHLGLTGTGIRKVRFLQEAVQATTTKHVTPSVAKDVILRCYPGHVYAGGVTGARHQVIHDEFDEEEEALLELPMGPCSLTFMLRSCIFPDRSRNMNTTPNPRNVWLCFTSCARELINDQRLRLPTLEEYLRAPAE